MLPEALDDVRIYLRDEGLDEEQIDEFLHSHDLARESDDDAWEIIDSHIFRE